MKSVLILTVLIAVASADFQGIATPCDSFCRQTGLVGKQGVAPSLEEFFDMRRSHINRMYWLYLKKASQINEITITNQMFKKTFEGFAYRDSDNTYFASLTSSLNRTSFNITSFAEIGTGSIDPRNPMGPMGLDIYLHSLLLREGETVVDPGFYQSSKLGGPVINLRKPTWQFTMS